MQSRIYPFATISAAVTTAALTALPWIELTPLGLDLSWNGLGIANADIGEQLGVRGPAWFTIGACVIAILAALLALTASATIRPFVSLANTIAAAACGLATLVPIITLIWPRTFYGDLMKQIGATDVAEHVPLSTSPLIALLVATIVTMLTCVMTAINSRIDPTTTSGE